MGLAHFSERKLVEVVFWIYLVGAVGFVVPFTQGVFIDLTPLNLLFSLIVLIYAVKSDLKLIHWGVFLLIYALGFIIELIGTNTGWPFGEYEYGSVLGVKLYETPLLIGVNWLVLILSTHLALSKTISNKVLIPFIGATAMLVFDLFLEPIAIVTGMWTWAALEIPFANYVSWWIIAFVLHFLMLLLRFESGAKVGMAVFVAQLVFFIVLNIFL